MAVEQMNDKIILLTNDDGINSPGLKASAEAVINLGKIIIVAPKKQQTSAGRSLKGHESAKLERVKYIVNGIEVEAYACDSTPALAVSHAFNILFQNKKPDLVISGINFGENLGTNSTISGTVGAAIEAATEGVKAIAVSRQTDISFHHEFGELDWTASKYFLKKFSESLLTAQMPFDVDILKIDVPDCANEFTEWKITKASREPYFIAELKEPNLNKTIGDSDVIIKFDESRLEENSDIKAVYFDKAVSVCPISIDLSSRINLDDFRKIF